jgi:hypothetical protein
MSAFPVLQKQQFVDIMFASAPLKPQKKRLNIIASGRPSIISKIENSQFVAYLKKRDAVFHVSFSKESEGAYMAFFCSPNTFGICFFWVCVAPSI